MEVKNVKKEYVVMMLVVLTLVGVGSFFGGMHYGKSKSPLGSQYGAIMMNGEFRGAPGGMRGGARTTLGAGFTTGEIIAKDDKSMTVKLQNGGSKIVFFSEATKVAKSTEGALSDLSVGNSVMITGASNPDGSVTASQVQLRPATSPVPAQ